MNRATLVNEHNTGNLYKLDPPYKLEGSLDSIDRTYIKEDSTSYIVIWFHSPNFNPNPYCAYLPTSGELKRVLEGETNIMVNGNSHGAFKAGSSLQASSFEECLNQIGYSTNPPEPIEYDLYDNVLL